MNETNSDIRGGQPSPTPPMRRRTWAIRATVIICLAVPAACVGAVCCPFFSLWHSQQSAVTEIEERGGEALGPAWAPKYVSLPNTSDVQICELVAALQRLWNLHKVTISGAGVTRNGVKCLRAVLRLAVLDLRETGLTGEDLVDIREALPGVDVWGPELNAQ